ncbi:MAG: gamma-glutamyl-gamma-aminobutyrate hydrolase family protein, partial [Spirochaetaceae bacterium]|nr:gamma-glutamyl-gamma-aminobutyrate hydrolase family protein [Spirochaetaceae bacterium]
PIIGITAFQDPKPRARYIALSEHYPRSVAAGGGLPLVLPTELGPDEPEAYLDLLDGLLLSGGGDVSPLLYGEDPSSRIDTVSGARDSAEIALFKAARARGMPVFGICRGLQLVNVAMGGSLVQDIPSEVPGASGHSPGSIPMDEPYHRITLLGRGSRLEAALRLPAGERTIAVNSFHHQAVKVLAPGLEVVARSADGVVEAFEGRREEPFLLCVQFHPEGMTLRSAPLLGLFAAFAAAAAEYRKAR